MLKQLRLISSTLLVMVCLNVYAEPTKISEQNLIYTNHEMLNFDIDNYLSTNAPHLLPYAESISHWAGTSSISPKVLIALMEHQTAIVSLTSRDNVDLDRPFATLSKEVGFNAQIKDVSMQLAKLHYDRQKPTQSSLTSSQQTSLEKLIQSSNQQILLSDPNGKQKSVADFTATLQALFPNALQTTSNPMQQLMAPPSNLLQLPYPVGEAWRYGGAHSNTGSGSVYSSLDFHNGGSWGNDLSYLWVKSSAPGTVKVHSSCNMEVIHANGWSTQYYHLDNIQYSTNQSVSRNQNIANYASNKNQALCEGGQSTGPHQHFSLKNNGSYASLDGVYLSGFKVNVGTSNYDTNCNRFWLEASDGSKKCSGVALNNPGVGTEPPPGDTPLQNGVAKTGLNATTGNYLGFTFAVPSGATNINIAMSGGSGDADMYVKFGSAPTDSSYDCRPYKSGNAETCTGNQTGGTYYVRLKAYSAFSGVSLTASYGGNSSTEVIVDNADNNTSQTGTWSASSGSPAHGSNSVYCNSGCTFSWTPALSASGSYAVYAWWTTHSNRSTNVPYTIDHNSGSTTVNVNQQNTGGQWVLLGTHNFSSGSSGKVTISSANGQANADAVRFVKQ